MSSVNPALKYEGEEGTKITMLDTQVSIVDGKIVVAMFEKAFSNPQALAYSSCHPTSCKDAIPLAAFKRIRRINSRQEDSSHWLGIHKNT